MRDIQGTIYISKRAAVASIRAMPGATPEDIAVGGTVHQPFVDEPISLSGAVDSTFSIA
jgi:hypothetical protein